MRTGFRLNPGSSMLAPCDFCNSKLALLYCRADSAKLCLLCDQQVHSANALSLRHIRSQIWDNCRAEPVSVRCCTENLMLCQDCGWDSHYNSSVSPLHERSPVEGFSGCPSVIELATFFYIKGDDLMKLCYGFGVCEPKMLNLEELRVPTQSCSVFISSEKHKQEVYRQLMEMGKKDLMRFNGDGAELGPGTPSSICDQQGYMESLEVESLDEEKLLQHQQTPFTSLLTFPNNVDLREHDCFVADSDLIWNWDPSYPAAQNYSNQPVSSHAPATEDSNYNTPIIGTPSERRPVEFETANEEKANFDVEMIAQNRINAILRHKEKKKNRRYVKKIRYN